MGNSVFKNVPETDMIEACPLCALACRKFFFRDDARDYFRCETCRLIFVPKNQWLSLIDEKARYDSHKNDPADRGYREFLGRLFIPLKEMLAPGSAGLDFGSGPGPALSVMFGEIGHSVLNFDCFYANSPGVFDKKYDFITATEVLEHLRDPIRELDRLWGCLTSGGYLGIMTQLAPEDGQFHGWYYKKDPTHICFFTRETFLWLRDHWQGRLTFFDKSVMIFQKN